MTVVEDAAAGEGLTEAARNALPIGRGQPSRDSDRPRIVVVLPRGEAIRNFVYSGAVDEVAREAHVTLLSVIPNDEFRDLLNSRYPNVLELEPLKEKWAVRFLREVLDLAHGRWLWSAAAQERWRRRDLEADALVPWLKRSVKKLLCYPFANRRGLEVLSNVVLASSRWLRTTDEFVRLLEDLRPSLVFNGSHVHGELAGPVVEAARWLGIPTATFVFSWDNLTSQGRVTPPYDYYLVWNAAIRDQLLRIYGSVRAAQVFVTGTPQFDFHFRSEFFWTRQEFCELVGADADRPIVLYSTGIAHHMPGEPEIVEGIADILRGMREFGPPQLLVRVYPKDDTKRFDELKRRRPDILFPTVPWVRAWYSPTWEDAYLLTNTLRHAALGINVASTMSLELAMFDKPVINVGYNPTSLATSELDYGRYYSFDHYRPVVESGAVSLVRSPEAMRNAIVRSLRMPGAGSAARQRLTRQVFGTFLDGRCGDRVAMMLLRLARWPVKVAEQYGGDAA